MTLRDRTPPAAAPTPSVALDPATARHLEELVRRLATQRGIRHALVAVARGDGSFRWVGTAGDATPDGSPMRQDTPFWIASVTKLFIAATVLRLYEQGRVSLDEPMASYLPADLVGGIHHLEGTDHTGAITVRHLLGHNSGLPDYLEGTPRGGKSLLDTLSERDASWTLEDAMRIVREELTPHFPPQPAGARRQRIAYSDTNYQLLIAIAEAVTGRPLHEIFEETLYVPLGLRHTYHPGYGPVDAPAIATVWAGDRPLEAPNAMRSFRDLNSTADDLLRFMGALAHGEPFDDPATRTLMTSHWNAFPFSLNPAPTSPTWPIAYGLGMMRFAVPRLFSPTRPVPPLIGHTGISGSWAFYCEDLDLVLAGTVDQMTAGPVPFRFAPKLVQAIARGGA